MCVYVYEKGKVRGGGVRAGMYGVCMYVCMQVWGEEEEESLVAFFPMGLIFRMQCSSKRSAATAAVVDLGQNLLSQDKNLLSQHKKLVSSQTYHHCSFYHSIIPSTRSFVSIHTNIDG